MPVQALLQAKLVQVVANETHRSAQDENAVQGPDLDVLLRLLLGEAAALAQKVDECDADEAVHVQDQVGLLPKRD